MDKIKLNLGCSDDLRLGHINVDRYHPGLVGSRPLADASLYVATHCGSWQDDCVYTADLGVLWPLKASTVDMVYAKDVFEHVDNCEFRGNRGKIWVLNESYRVLKPGGRAS